VGRLIRGLPAQVNLIPSTRRPGYCGAASRSEAARRFQRILADDYGLPSTVRQRRGNRHRRGLRPAGLGGPAAPQS
jgi:23S rRNA (adenine2503-C2)-methyltransferase